MIWQRKWSKQLPHSQLTKEIKLGKGGDCGKLAGYQVRQELIQMTAGTLETASISTFLLDFVKT